MEQLGSISINEHVIDVAGHGEGSPSTSSHRLSNELSLSQQEDITASAARILASLAPISSSNGSNSRNTSFVRRGDTRRRRSPLNSGLWISIELVLTVSQIIASIVVLSLSRDERPRAPLFAWIVGYASGCVAIVPLLYWRYRHNNPPSEQDVAQSRQNSQITVSAMPFSLSVSRSPEGEDSRGGTSSLRSRQGAEIMNARIKALVEYFKMGLDCFFAIWFVVGNVWIFGGHSSANVAPNLYRLCIVFLTFSCIGYAMPFILCATICCCLPCIISALGFREDLTHNRGATSESIDALPTYKFKLKKNRSGNNRDSNSGVSEGGIIAAGTEKERVISGEDAVCCICLAKYANNDELREMPCSHFFHKDCLDKWLKINATCPLCKNAVGDGPFLGSFSGGNAGHENSDS
ncbi:E3 ubiquitin-protein ligase At1g63170 [Humulus lupulus]|uniref:E3 ubiquitin-protein ligase At1g63170 n=1 Tax=Humulus lupulus TaxID=3486 RepID=UPI002B40CB0A|nr:E3 ubiquitin-protein ligase At1g63170 [Humulus lupulus]XP_062101269.1 E3 ubiquitin-protein ligase At1g63170 [Humulus lupulus]